jgi:Lipocalin-like domain
VSTRALFVVALLASGCAASRLASLEGCWGLVAADKQLPDGRVVHDYGERPQGRLLVDARGRYSLQIFSPERPGFAAGDKAKGTEAEMRAAVMGSSTHYGAVRIDWKASTLTFVIADASFPNWRGETQTRSFVLEGDLLTYRVPPRPDGSVPISVWRREP